MMTRPSAHQRLTFALLAGLILAVAAWVRLPGLHWERGLPHASPGYTLHPDEWTFLAEVDGFHLKSPTGKGYVRGWTSHGWLLSQAARRLLGMEDVNLVTGFRALSLLYGLFTVGLMLLIGATLFRDRALGLLAASLLSLSGLHIVNSHFGTADAAAAFYFTLAIVLAVLCDRTRNEWAWLGLGAAVGAGLAVKFQLSLLPLVAVVCLRAPRRWLRLAQVSLALIASFELFSLFNYTPWEMRDFYHMLRRNVYVAPLPPVDFLYGADILARGVGFGTSLLLVAAAIGWLLRARRAPVWQGGRWLRSQWLYFLIPAACQYAMVADMDFRSARQLVGLVPVVCLAAAQGALWLWRRAEGTTGRRLIGACLAAAIAYQGWYAWSIESLYVRDPRFAASRWLSARVQPGEAVTGYLWYSKIPGAYEVVEAPAEYVLGASLEYERYLRADDPADVVHPIGGPDRWRFWNQLFRGELDYEPVQRFTLMPSAPELRGRPRDALGQGLGTFVPHTVVIFHQRGAS